ncbi:hypothetical protein ABZ135_33105 [Streptomyces sp. NPDC006339]|uniref:hypothetical protein n=1 Tax=Streptomyces sp. NPDC006339 TaxID=3156755 RepID=UPI0033A5265E
MIRRLARTGAILGAASLLLTACSGGGSPAPKAAPAKHPVFDGRLDRQLLLAVRETRKAGDASFTQKLTFTSGKSASGKGDVVRTTSGRLDFAGGRGQADVAWTTPAGLPEPTRTVLVGQTAARTPGAPSAAYLVDGQRIHYRADSSSYWIRYTTADTTQQGPNGPLEHLRGTEAPVGGTLLEGIGSAEASARSDGPDGRTYRAGLPFPVLRILFPDDLGRHLAVTLGTSVTQEPVPLTVTTDRQGRITRARADLTRLLRKDGPFAGFTGLTMELTLRGHGTSATTASPTGDVRTASKDVLPLRDVKDGGCVDFDNGQRLAHIVVRVSCSGPHDARVFTQITLRAGTTRKDTQERADTACQYAHDVARPGWMPKVARIWAWWTPEPAGGSAKGRVTCYLTTKRGES